MIGVLGGYGAVGSVALRQLASWGIGPLRIGGRDGDRAAGLAADLTGAIEVSTVDVTDAGSLARFCDGCAVVLNCAGPARHLGDRAARAAVAAGAGFVDAAGDDSLHAALANLGTARPVVLSAGMMPGLTGLLPRYLAGPYGREQLAATRLTGYVGGRDRFTATAALDYLAVDGYGEPLAAWRDGARRSRVLVPLDGVRPPSFPEPVTAAPYLAGETERLARRLGLGEVHWYSVFAGTRVLGALRGTGGPAQLCRAAELDLFGHEPYQHLVIELSGRIDAALVLRGTGASALTGAAAAIATRAVHAGEVPGGVHHAAEVLDPAASAGLLRGSPAVRELTVAEYVEEGVL